MSLIALNLPPGIYRQGTEYQSQGRWYDSNLVRWFAGTIQPVGGWAKLRGGGSDLQVTGSARGSHSWTRNDGITLQMAIGTHSRLYYYSGAALFNITPAGLTVGSASTVVSVGYGSGAYGRGPYGGPSVTPRITAYATTWDLDNFGEVLLALSSADGKLYKWENNPAAVAVAVVASTGVIPTGSRGLVVTAERIAMILGAGGNPRKVQWSDIEDYTAWLASATTQAGDQELQTKGMLQCGFRVRGGTLLLTTEDAHLATYLGPPYVYGFERLGTACGIVSKKAGAVVDDRAVWMGLNNFFQFNGYTQQLPCEVADYVFSRLNQAQAAKVHCVPGSKYTEVTWHYPSTTNECDSYVTWNYKENTWAIGSLNRTTGVDRGVFTTPVLIDDSGYLYQHETGSSWGGALPYCQSGPAELGAGDKVLYVSQIIPDERNLGDVSASFSARFQPNGAETVYGPYTLTAKTDVRVAARQLGVKLITVNPAKWRVGKFRFDAIAGGGR